MSELKPCPCCGGEAVTITMITGSANKTRCINCGLQTLIYYDPGESQEKWNQRIEVQKDAPGKWTIERINEHELNFKMKVYQPIYKCSACGRITESYLRFDTPIMPEDADFPYFCPNCGADMRGDDNG